MNGIVREKEYIRGILSASLNVSRECVIVEICGFVRMFELRGYEREMWTAEWTDRRRRDLAGQSNQNHVVNPTFPSLPFPFVPSLPMYNHQLR